MDSDKLNSGIGVCSKNDIRWVCSLNDSELDFVISLKVMLLRRPKQMASNNFDFKFLRALSFIIMNKLKGHLEVMPAGSIGSLDNCKLLKFDNDTSFKNLSIQELETYICTEKRKRLLSKLLEDMPPGQKPRTASYM
ncbi:unnamed protein product [Cuscuta europaea]|uniref:Uncharacterized protein n=1 Tax=Cuscuta europaea TaxID=41803 RepID=A0A9P0Z1F3_CUSEU|nr:unnamed protein product [Cuscuta europaea]